ncbi:MAG: nucleotide sugar dehydrogenase [Gemmatimonadetes bacterium]|nr:nucleotide sugar dehydrogenase [Gemmatimonadota bacterium]
MNEEKTALAEKIRTRTAKVGIVGLGYVGLPLAVEFARAGFTVTGIDVQASKVAQVNAGSSYIQDIPTSVIQELVDQKKLSASTDFSVIRDLDTINICVPTPLRKTRDPDVSYIVKAVEQIAPRLRRGRLVVLESTTYPGTTRDLMQPRLEALGYTIGEDVFLAFSPERVDPGNPTWHTKNTPKIIGGIAPSSTEVASALYKTCIDTVVPVSSPEAAELAKLLENTFRSVNIGLVNEMAIICDRLGVDVWEVIDAAATKPFGFMKFTPGPGIGGHCIPLDPHYLAWKMRTLNYKTRFIDLASEINSAMPDVVVEKVARALNDVSKAVKGSRALVLGVAYKRDIDDMRESPAFDVIRLLEERGATVVFHDPHVPKYREDGHERTGVALTDDELEKADVVVIVTDHRAVDYGRVVRHASLVVDTRNALANVPRAKARVVSLSALHT